MEGPVSVLWQLLHWSRVFMFIAQVDKCRGEKGLPGLKTFVIDVISHSSPRLEAEDVEALKLAKMSSTYIRQWIVSREKERER